LRISALLSDFDGTLCPTSSLKHNLFQKSVARIPQELEVSLLKISQLIPVHIISSKDFDSLHMATRSFASIISCVLGIETINHVKHEDETIVDCIAQQHFNTDMHTLTENSKILNSILEQEKIQHYIHERDICIDRKFTSCNNKTLIGITFDYRHLDNWETFKRVDEPRLLEITQHIINEHKQLGGVGNIWKPYIQTYTSHPFLDLYAVKCDKGLAFDSIFKRNTSNHTLSDSIRNTRNVLYLGDSENDNPAFRRSDISIGVSSDKRLNPKLACKYSIEFKHPSIFLNRLIESGLIFSEDLLKFPR
jgi:hydroxymethylpyrimidine pyrophosphatase-like HAD family hydrolase